MLTWRAWTLFSPDKLKTEEDAKLGRILTKQRYHQNQLQNQTGPLRSDTFSPRSPRSPNTSGEVSKGSNSPRQGSESSPRDLTSTAESSRSTLTDRQPVTAWTSVREESSFTSRTSSSARSPHSGEELVVQDVSPDDFETRSSVSLLDSESIYLPVDVAGTPSNRPMTAPAATTPGTTAFITALTTNNVRPSTGMVDSRETKYESLERRVIRPLNQAKGPVKPMFDFSPPQSSGTGPTTRVRRPTPPTAESQDYDTSIDASNLSDPENMEKVPTRELSLIKDKVGARKAQKTAAPTIQERKAKLFSKKAEKSDLNKSNIPVPNNTQRMPSANKTISDSKSVKGKLNLEKFEESGRQKTLTATGSSVRDSGFLSRPCSDAVLGDTTNDVEQRASILIQACWRGYWTREHNPQVVSVRKEIRARRAEDHIVLLKTELERYKHQSMEEKKLRALQMEAIKTLWQEVQSLQTWKSEVLSSQTFRSSHDSNNKQHYLSVSGSQRSSSSTDRSDTLDRLSDSTLRSAFSPVDVERQKDLEKTCVSLQSQVSQLKEALDTISTAVFHSACFTLSHGQEPEETGSLRVTGNFEHELASLESDCSPCSGRWSSVPHSLSPYPSEEEESYFRQVPQVGVPTPPRALQLEHKGDNSIMLHWQASRLTDDTGNRSILGYRVYVNDKCMALVSSTKTLALVNGLDCSTTYKFYVKSLSGLGESYESNIIMAKLAKGSEQRRVSESSDSDMPDDSDKDHDSTESHEKRRHRKRETRKTRKVKSPRSEKTKSYMAKDADSRNETKSASPAPSDRPRIARAASDAASAILTTPKRHMHKRNKSGDYHKINISDGNIDSSQSSKRESEGNVQSSPSDIPPVSSSSSPSSVTSSPTKSYPQHHIVLTQAKSVNSEGSNKPSSESALTDSRDTTNLAGTFTVDQASSYLQSITASVVKETIASSKAKLRESQEKDDSVKTHRRKRSSDFKLSDLTDGKGDRRSGGSGDADSVSELDGDNVVHRLSDRKETERRLSDGASDDSRDGKVKGHRRKRSKDLQTAVSDWKKDDEVKSGEKPEAAAVGKDGDGSSQNRPIIDGRKRHPSGSRPSSPMLNEQGDKDVFEKRRTPMAETLEQRLLNMSSKSNSMGSLNSKAISPNPDNVPRPRQLPDPNVVFEESAMRKRTASLGSEGDLPQTGKSDQKSFAAKLLHKLQTFSKSQEKIREKSRRKSSGSSRDSKPPSDDEGRRPRRTSDSDHEASSDTSSLPRKHGDSSSGSHSDDSRSTRPRKTHRRTPSDGKLMPPASPGLDGERPTHSPIIMEGAMMKKGGSNVKRHASFHGLLPSKQDKHGAQAGEEGEHLRSEHGSVALPMD